MTEPRLPLRFLLAVVLVTAGALLVACSDTSLTDPPTAPLFHHQPGHAGGPGGGDGNGDGNGDPTVDSVEPESATQDTTLDITVSGSGFDEGSTVELERNDDVAEGITTNSTTFINKRRVVANITIAADAELGKYDVAVTTSRGRKGIGIELFELVYELVDLGTAPGFSNSAALDLAETGGVLYVVGSNGGDGTEQATLWTVTEGQVDDPTLLGRPGEAWYWAAGAIATDAGAGIIAGNSSEGPVQWDLDSHQNAVLLPLDNATDGWAHDVALVEGGNPMVVGSRRWIVDGSLQDVEAAYWLDGELHSLPRVENRRASAHSVNSSGTIAGWLFDQGLVIWHRPTNGDEYQVCRLETSGKVNKISEEEDGSVYVVGASDASDWYATEWKVDLGGAGWDSPPGGSCMAQTRRLDFSSEFNDVTAGGVAVGQDIQRNRAILWTAAGELIELPHTTTRRRATHGRAYATNAATTHIVGAMGGSAVLWRAR